MVTKQPIHQNHQNHQKWGYPYELRMRYLSSHEFSWHFCERGLVEGYLLVGRFKVPSPGSKSNSPKKSKKTPQTQNNRADVINHGFPVSELLFSRPSFTDRVLRLLAETSWGAGQMRARTDDDVSRDSGRLRATPGDSAPLAPNASVGDAVELFPAIRRRKGC